MEHSTLVWPPVTMSDPADREVLVELRARLSGVADAHGLSRHPVDTAAARAARAALDGALLTAHTELVTGDRQGLRELIPTFVYLIVLPLAGDAAALSAGQEAEREGARWIHPQLEHEKVASSSL